jgi:predicted amidophosphoribosyltransferase
MYCQFCGKPIPPDSFFCNNCGKKIPVEKGNLFHEIFNFWDERLMDFFVENQEYFIRLISENYPL